MRKFLDMIARSIHTATVTAVSAPLTDFDRRIMGARSPEYPTGGDHSVSRGDDGPIDPQCWDIG